MVAKKILLNTDALKKIFNFKGVKNTLQNNNKELQLPYFFFKRQPSQLPNESARKFPIYSLGLDIGNNTANSIHLTGVYSFRILG